MSDLSLLLDMGFPQERAEKALIITGNKGVEPAAEWLLAHNDDADDDRYLAEAALGGNSQATAEKDISVSGDVCENINDANLDAKSIKCDECNHRFKTDSEVEFHAIKTGHQSFSQSSEEIKPLTEEEKQERIKKIENIIKLRRVEKEEQEKKNELEREKTRRKTGQELSNARQRLLEEEIKTLAEQKKKEKLEEKLARQRVLEAIERDKQARKEKFGMASTPAPPVATPDPVPVVPPQTYDECKLQIRLTNGQCLTQTFSSKEELAAVRLYIEMNRTDGSGPFSLMTNFPKKVFTEVDMNAPLNSLGLVPSAVLIVSKQQM